MNNYHGYLNIYDHPNRPSSSLDLSTYHVVG